MPERLVTLSLAPATRPHCASLMRTPRPLWNTCRLFWASSSSILVKWAHVANRHEELERRPLQLATILCFAWGTRRDTLGALCIALPRAEATHGISAWCWTPARRPTARRIPQSSRRAK
ncbi:hypothetical protein TcCL_NonESM11415 [Trypanosoma cruzi]|nr:hypothetical protein TcCL_NonESM11415 [Trypanosoma cruzi]